MKKNIPEKLLLLLVPGSIEAGKKRGQNDLVRASKMEICQLPAKSDFCDPVEIYELLGFEIIGKTEDDDLFMDIKMKIGWTIKPTDHSMYSDLLDEKGRKRASIFFKASFYDKKADIRFERRISLSVNRIGFQNNDYSQDENHRYNSEKTALRGIVKDYDGKVLFKTKEYDFPIFQNHTPDQDGYRTYNFNKDEIEAKLRLECLDYLEHNYPEWESYLSYWDEHDLQLKK